ncbi:MAG: hypothetical protein MJ051_07070 [Akkermansia sp.]|nr:hypothetical protein [Akkermansia sp.]
MSFAADSPCWILGTGFLGSRLRACLSHAVGIDSAAPAEVQGDAADAAVLARAAAMAQPAAVFCCLSTHGGDAAAYRRTYLDTLRALPEGARVIFCSALSAGQGASEKAAILREAEAQVLARGGVVVRLAALYGEGRCELLRRHRAGEPRLAGADTRRLNYIHVEDAAAALLAAAAAPSAVYTACGDSLTKAEAYAMLETATGVPAAADSAPEGRRGVADVDPQTVGAPVPHWVPQIHLADWCRHA